MPGDGVLTPLLKVFLFNFTQGTARLTPDALWLLGPFLGLEICLAAIYFLWRKDVDYGSLVMRFLTAVILGWLITNWSGLTGTLVKSFQQAGIKAGGDAISDTDMSDPDTIVLYGFSVTAVIFGDMANASVFSPKTYAVAYLMGFVASAVVIVYILLAIAVFLSILEFYAGVTLTVLLLPWGMLPRLAFLAEKAIAYVFAGGIRIFAISFVLSVSLPVLVTANVTLQPTLATAFRLAGQALALCFLAWGVNRFVQGLLHGAASLVPHDITQFRHSVTNSITTLGATVQALTHPVQHLGGGTGQPPRRPSRRRVP